MNPTSSSGNIRTDNAPDSIKQAFLDNLRCAMARVSITATKHDAYFALALTVRDRLFHRAVGSIENYARADARRVAYLSAEFLPGPHLANNLLNLGIVESAREAMSALGYDLDELIAQEEEPGLGNGGLGRLASCYMDSLASVEVPGVGYGIRYEFGIFDQKIQNGWQAEVTDKWLRFGNPWEVARPEVSYEVKFGGRTEARVDEQGRFRVRWIPQTEIKGVAYDTPRRPGLGSPF
jgi:starch phosphorylase